MSNKTLFDSYSLGPNKLRNRIVMAPLTRSRALKNDVMGDLNAEYYAQRASAGLIITEASQVSQQGQGYLFTPGSYSAEQVQGWRKVVKAVHEKGGRQFLQLWHVGRVSHTGLQPNNQAPISATEKPALNTMSFAYDAEGKPANQPASAPRQATLEDLKQVIADYRNAAKNALDAGFDGVELHGANGYLFDQFLNSSVNERTDEYGNQTKESRAKLLLETFDVVAEVVGAERIGVRISPFGTFAGMLPDPKTAETFLYLAQELSKRGAVYIHVVRGNQNDNVPVVSNDFLKALRNAYNGTILVTGGMTKENGSQLLQDNLADLIGFGRPFIANPDLVARLKNDWSLNPEDRTTWYGGNATGYVDYAPYSQTE